MYIKLDSSQLKQHQVLGPNLKNLKHKPQNRNNHIRLYPCTKLQLIWRTSDFATKLAQENMNDKKFEKIKIKFEIRIQQRRPVPNFSQFGELQFLGPDLNKKHFKMEYLEQTQPDSNLF